jgi:NitT/TauT family transport system permease protein
MRNNLMERIIKIISPIALLLIWELFARMQWIDVRFFPAPFDVLQVLITMIVSGELWEHLAASLYRVFAGFIIGGVSAILLGMIMGLSRRKQRKSPS